MNNQIIPVLLFFKFHFPNGEQPYKSLISRGFRMSNQLYHMCSINADSNNDIWFISVTGHCSLISLHETYWYSS